MGCTSSKDINEQPKIQPTEDVTPPTVITPKSGKGSKKAKKSISKFDPSELAPIIEKQPPVRHPSRSVSRQHLTPVVMTYKVDRQHHTVNQYTKIRKIGEGGFSKVYLYKDAHGNEFAVKKMCRSALQKRKTYSNDPITKRLRVVTAYDTVLHEIRVIRYIHNSSNESLAHVCRVYEIIDDPDCDNIYMIMEPGHCTLAVWNPDLYSFSCPDSPTGRLQEEDARGIFVQLLSALKGLRLIGVIHHDIKPQNIIITRQGAKLIDFGSAIVIPWDNPSAQQGETVDNPAQGDVGDQTNRAGGNNTTAEGSHHDEDTQNEPVEDAGDKTTDLSGDTGTLEPDTTKPEAEYSLTPIESKSHNASYLKRDVGTPFFASPEVFKGQYNGFDSDLWALGVSMYCAVTGKLPFLDLRSNPTATLAASIELIKTGEFEWPTKIPVSAEFKHLINWILSVDPLDRPTLDMCGEHPWFHMLTITSNASPHVQVDDEEDKFE